MGHVDSGASNIIRVPIVFVAEGGFKFTAKVRKFDRTDTRLLHSGMGETRVTVEDSV